MVEEHWKKNNASTQGLSSRRVTMRDPVRLGKTLLVALCTPCPACLERVLTVTFL